MKITLLLFVVLLVLLPSSQLSASSDETICLMESPSIVVTVKTEKMHLCNGKHLFKTYSISRGKKGWGKKKQGDKKTPIGCYPIGKPRTSKKFHIFIPIGYPTQEQKQQGYTGSAIGIHGPYQPLRWLGRLNNLLNWTQGCIAVGRNSDINDISKWIIDKNPKYILIN